MVVEANDNVCNSVPIMISEEECDRREVSFPPFFLSVAGRLPARMTLDAATTPSFLNHVLEHLARVIFVIKCQDFFRRQNSFFLTTYYELEFYIFFCHQALDYRWIDGRAPHRH